MTNIFLGEPAGHADTWYKYANDTDWRVVSIKGIIQGIPPDVGDPQPTTQIPNITQVVDLEIGDDVTGIGDFAFFQCFNNLKYVKIGNNVKYIGGEASFYECMTLETVIIPNGVESIGQYTFFSCSSLTSITIPSSVMSIGECVFSDCDGLTSVTFLGKTMQQVQDIEDANGQKQYPWGINDTSIINVA